MNYIGVGASSNCACIGAYTYCGNNSVNYNDSSGKAVTVIICGVAFSVAEIAIIIVGATFILCYCCDKTFRNTVDDIIVYVLTQSIDSVKQITKKFDVSKTTAKIILKIAMSETFKKNFQLDKKSRTKIPKNLKMEKRLKRQLNMGTSSPRREVHIHIKKRDGKPKSQQMNIMAKSIGILVLKMVRRAIIIMLQTLEKF